MNKQQLINKIHRGYNHYYGVILTFLHEKVYKDKTPGGRSLNYIITPPIQAIQLIWLCLSQLVVQRQNTIMQGRLMELIAGVFL